MFKNIYEDTGVLPKELRNKPTLRSDCAAIYDAFRHLSVSRSWTQAGPNAIKPSDALALFEIWGITSLYLRALYFRLITIMDGVHLEYLAKKAKQK